MKVIFLDIDGVLNTTHTWSLWPEDRRFQPELVQRVSDLADATESHLVISSAWRHHNTLTEITDFLVTHGLRDRSKVIGITPNFPWPAVREEEILAWLAVHPEVTDWAILDDDTAGDHQWEQVIDHMVFINPTVGVTEADCVEAKEILTRHGLNATPTAPSLQRQ